MPSNGGKSTHMILFFSWSAWIHKALLYEYFRWIWGGKGKHLHMAIHLITFTKNIVILNISTNGIQIE